MIGLHGKPEPVPSGKRRVAQYRTDNIERQFQPVGFFRVDGEIELVRLGEPRQHEQIRRQLAQHALARSWFVTRMQRGQFYRNTRPVRQRGIARGLSCRFADGADGIRIRLEIAFGVGGRTGALAQHVEGIEGCAAGRGARQRLLDRLPEHEMRAEQPHGLAGGGAHRRQAESLDQRLDDAVRRLARMDDAGGQPQGPGRRRYQERSRAGIVPRPVPASEFVLDQPVGGIRVRHPQQRLGQHHQRQALLGGERVGVQEILHPAEPAGALADRRHQRRGAGIDARLGRWRAFGALQQGDGQAFIRRSIGCPERLNAACPGGGLCRWHGSASKI